MVFGLINLAVASELVFLKNTVALEREYVIPS